MQPVTYLNLYILVILGFIGGTAFGTYFFYEGMETTSFLVSTSAGQTRFFFDKNQYDFYFQGFIFCITFLVAGVLLLTVMAIPGQQVFYQRASMAPAGGGAQFRQVAPQPMRPAQPPPQMQPMAPPMPPPQPMAPPQPMGAPQPMAAPQPMGAPQQPQAPSQAAAPQAAKAEPVEEDFLDEDFDFDDESRTSDAGDADVVYGTGRITEEATVEFIHKHADSAIKFLYRKNLDGKPLQASEEEIYQTWQKRGLSRNKVREYVLQIMEWDALPEQTLMDTWSQLRDQLFELTH